MAKTIELTRREIAVARKLIDVPMSGGKMRRRNRFAQMLDKEHLKPMEELRIDKLQGLANKDQSGEPIIKDGHYDLGTTELKTLDEWSQDYLDNYPQEFVMEAENLEHFRVLRDVLNEHEKKSNFNVEQGIIFATLFDKVADAL